MSKLSVPPTIERDKTVSLGVTYTVRGPSGRRAQAKVVLRIAGVNLYSVSSRVATVRPAIWKWSVRDRLPSAMAAGRYNVTATVTLTRGKTRVAQSVRRSTVTLR